MSLHSFDPDIAKSVGVNSAVIYQNILFWTEKNFRNNRNIHHGFVWTYNSVKAWAELFPYLTPKQIRGALEKLEREGLIASGNYNKSAYDRTKWYGVSTCLFGKIDLPAGANEVAHKGEPIPDSKPDHKPDDKHIAHSEHDRFDEFWCEVPRKIGKGQARKAWKAALKKTDADSLIAGIRRFAAEKRGHDPQFIAHPATWLNGERWEDEGTRQPQELHDQIDNQLKGKTNGLSIEDADFNGADERFSAQLPAPTLPDGRSGVVRDSKHCGGGERSLRDFINPRRFP